MRFWDGEFSILLILHMLLMNAGFFILETELCKNGQVSSLQVLQRYAEKFYVSVCKLKLFIGCCIPSYTDDHILQLTLYLFILFIFFLTLSNYLWLFI